MLNYANILGALMAARYAGVFPMGGQGFEKLAVGLAQGVSQWGVGQIKNLACTGSATGLAGGGAVIPVASRITVPPDDTLMRVALVSAGMLGPNAQSLGSAVAKGIAVAFTSFGQYTGVVAGVSNGADISKITQADPQALTQILMSTLGSSMGAGPALPMLAAGLSNGITMTLKTGTGQGQVAGVPTFPPVPASTVTYSMVI